MMRQVERQEVHGRIKELEAARERDRIIEAAKKHHPSTSSHPTPQPEIRFLTDFVRNSVGESLEKSEDARTRPPESTTVHRSRGRCQYLSFSLTTVLNFRIDNHTAVI